VRDDVIAGEIRVRGGKAMRYEEFLDGKMGKPNN
jgi:hypothetical protein